MSCFLLQIVHRISLSLSFVDFTKAFDVIDHNVLFNKFVNCGMPEHVVSWSMDFLCGRKQFVKIADSVSSVFHVTAGTSQTSGPSDFKLIINDLQFDIGYVKFVTTIDTTTFSVSNDPHNCLLQKAADYLGVLDKRKRNGYKYSKTQEMVVYFGKQLCVDLY